MITKLQNPKFFKQHNQRSSIRKRNDFVGGDVYHSEKNFTAEDKYKIVVDGQSNNVPIENLCRQKGITIEIFQKWTEEFLSETPNTSLIEDAPKALKDDDKYRIVIEGKSGLTSVAEICRREGISQDEFFSWCEEFLLIRNRQSILRKLNSPVYKKNQSIVNDCAGPEVLKFINYYVDLSSKLTLVKENLIESSLPAANQIGSLVTLEKINDVRFINKYFESVNSQLSVNGIFIGCFETFTARKKRMRISRIPFVRDVYFTFEFLFKRILPKVSFTKKFYFDITKGSDRLLSKAEGLGRLVSCGFSIMDVKSVNGLTYFVVKKTGQPLFDLNPSYGPIYKMPRIGKNGEIIGVYKFRTMHPYSEYLQDYIVKANGYAHTGKPANDFRIPAWGKFMRRFWLDELPQILNVLKGEMKLVGVRPVSKRYFEDIPLQMQKLRLTQKPGCIPPYVSLNRDGNVMSVLRAEKDYLTEKIRNPYTTDVKYFFCALKNIIFLSKRSA